LRATFFLQFLLKPYQSDTTNFVGKMG
jgi:hypothetical protein